MAKKRFVLVQEEKLASRRGRSWRGRPGGWGGRPVCFIALTPWWRGQPAKRRRGLQRQPAWPRHDRAVLGALRRACNTRGRGTAGWRRGPLHRVSRNGGRGPGSAEVRGQGRTVFQFVVVQVELFRNFSAKRKCTTEFEDCPFMICIHKQWNRVAQRLATVAAACYLMSRDIILLLRVNTPLMVVTSESATYLAEGCTHVGNI
jgi:hypothetical protein